MKTKIYPRVSVDTAIKFVFDDEWRHYTIRLAWQPLFLTEQLYKDFWWTTFLESYSKYLDSSLDDEKEIEMIKQAIKLTKTFTDAMARIWDRWRSPIVIYADDYMNK